MVELLKLLQKNTTTSDQITSFANFAHYDEEFAGNIVKPPIIDLNCWIIDTGPLTTFVPTSIYFTLMLNLPLLFTNTYLMIQGYQ